MILFPLSKNDHSSPILYCWPQETASNPKMLSKALKFFSIFISLFDGFLWLWNKCCRVWSYCENLGHLLECRGTPVALLGTVFLRWNSYVVQFTHLKHTFYSSYHLQLCKHHPQPILEHFYHPKKKCHTL